MPRAGSSAKRQQGATSNRDTRHENGLVGPGKRIAKQKSQSQLDGSPRPRPDDDSCATPTPFSSSSTAMPSSTATTNGFARHNHHPDAMTLDHKTSADGLRRASLGTYSGHSSTDSLASRPTANQTAHEESHRSINVNDAKNSNVHRDTGPLDLAFTVLRSCPLHDTIAILIILMQVSPVALATIYMLFTLLTFVPPVTTSSGLSITEIFDGNQGTPSLTTLLCMDVVMLGIWLFLWAPMQQFILDLAQVVISLTLGGGGTSRHGTTNNIFLCVAIVGFSQWSRHARGTGFPSLGSMFGQRLMSPGADNPLESTARAFDKKGPYGWIRSILAIHILTQGLVRYIREWYLRREKRDLLSQSQQDPEVGKASSFVSDANPDGGSVNAETDSGTQSSANAVSTKKKRKQSAQVRIRQPLWAALASTKIVMVKEYELSHAASESAGSNATDIHNLGNAPFNTQPEQIWICYVGCDEVCFSTSHFPRHLSDEDSLDECSKASGIDTTKPFYVRVNHAVWQPTRIIPIEAEGEADPSGTRWTGDIYGLTPLSNYECEFVSTRTGDVLFSTSVRTIQAKTKDLEATAKAASNSNARTHHRHDSPATTLRASIAAAEAKLADEKTRLKTARKDNNRKLNTAKKDIEKLTSAVQSAGGNDEKLKQKVAQNNIQQKQTEQSIEDVEGELKELESVPEALLERYRTRQTAWASEKAQFDGARASFKSFRTSIEREVKALTEEQGSLQAKRNKAATRLSKVDSEHARITDANARGLDEAERRRQERAAAEAEAIRAEQMLADRITRARASNADKQAHLQAMAAQLQAYLSSFQEELGYDGTAGASSTSAQQPAGSFNHAAPWATANASYPAQPQPMWPPAASAPTTTSVLSMVPPQVHSSSSSTPFAPSPFANPAQLHQQQTTTSPAAAPITNNGHKSRGRSSSMLSNVSGLTQSTDGGDSGPTPAAAATPAWHQSQPQQPPSPLGAIGTRPPGFGAAQRHRHRRRGGSGGGASRSGSGSGSSSSGASASVSGSGSGSGSGGSVRDPTSPI